MDTKHIKTMFIRTMYIMVILAVALSVTGSAYAQDEPPQFSVNIRAYIDGYSQLVIQGNNVYWHHIGAAAPGRHLFGDEPTYLNGAAWNPTWPDDPDAENRECNCDSSTSSDLIPPLPGNQSFVLNVIQARFSAHISQQPNVDNNYTLIIDFDDWPPDGPAWYEVELVQGVPPSMEGGHWGSEGIAHPNSCSAFGGAQDPDDTSRQVQIHILADGEEIASGFTSDWGFYFNLWGLIPNYVNHIIKAQAYDEETSQWVDLAGTPKMLNCVNYDIYILNNKDGTVERLTTLENTGEYNPSWSPDGKKIVHDVTDADFHALYVTDVKTHVSNPLPGADGGNDAAWSPNGKWIVFDRRWNDDPNLYLLPPTGGTPKLVVSNAVNGDWSPDSRRLVFEHDGALWTARVKGDDEKQIAEAGSSPVWSPNGMWIAYDLNGDIWKVRVNAAGARIGDPIQLTSSPAYEAGATWSRDSKQIAFFSDASGDADIWQISAEGGTPVRLARTSIYGDYDPAYASSGQYIAYDGAKEPSQPYIAAFPEWGYIEGQDWPMNDTVRLTIDDPATEAKPDYEAEQTTVATSWGNWWVQFNFDYDLKVGDKVTQTDGYVTRTYSVRNLGVTAVSFTNNTVAGIAEPDAVVYLWVWDHDGSYMELITTQDGTWLADFDSIGFDLAGGMCGRAEVRDKIGNRTAVDWCVPNPRIVASESGDWFWTTDFYQGLLNISIYETADEGATLLWSGQQEADQGGFIIVGSDVHGLDLVPGNYLVISDGVNQKALVLQTITLDVFDTTNEVMAGTAPAGSEVCAAAGPQDWQERIMVQADPLNGEWLADFKSIGFDITEDMRPWSYAHIYDEDGDANEGSTPPPPPPPARVVVQITDDWFRAENFTPNGDLTFWVYDAQDGTLLRHPDDTWQLDDSGYITISMWELEEYIDLVPGYYLVVTDGILTKDIVLEELTFDIFDLTNGQLMGTAPAPFGRAVWVGIGWENEYWTMDVTTGGDGTWIADFGKPVPTDYWWVAAQIFDEDGDASEIRPGPIIGFGE